MALAPPCCALPWGRHGTGLGPQGCTHDARRCIVPKVACIPSCIRSLSNATPFSSRASSSQPFRAWIKLLSPALETAAARRPGDRSLTLVVSPDTCSLQTLSLSFTIQLLFNFSPTYSLLFTKLLSLSRASGRGTSQLLIFVLHLHHRASRPPGPLLPSDGRCVIRYYILHRQFLELLFPTSSGPDHLDWSNAL